MWHWDSSPEPSSPPSLCTQCSGAGTQCQQSSVLGEQTLQPLPCPGVSWGQESESGAAAPALGAAEAELQGQPEPALSWQECLWARLQVNQPPLLPCQRPGISTWTGPLDTCEQPAFSRISFSPMYSGDIRQVQDSTASFYAALADTASTKGLNLEYPHISHWIRPKQVDFGLNTSCFC